MLIERESVVAVVGCGGKTALIADLAARAPRDFRVLIATTTKIYPPPGAIAADHAAHTPHAGAQCMGIPDGRTGKLGPLPEELLKSLIPRYDLVLLEADGSRGLPLKGWRADEPVIPPYATHTLGVLPVRALGLPATEEFVLRLPEFLALTGLERGEITTPGAIARVVDRMFAGSRGREMLFINQVERGEDVPRARAMCSQIRRNALALRYGSAHRGEWHAFEGEGLWPENL